jgi:C_GCAxxG_C_C family probable redox protein
MKQSVDLVAIRNKAEAYYRDGDFYCSEAIIKTIKDAFGIRMSDDVVALASGFPVGMGGAGCACGAVTGGVMALGMFFGRTSPRDKKSEHVMRLSKELHDLFRERHGRLCCRKLTRKMELGSPRHMEQCIAFTGEVAYETGRIIIRELDNR